MTAAELSDYLVAMLRKVGVDEDKIEEIERDRMRESAEILRQAWALIDAGWKMEPMSETSEIWQWAWRRPPIGKRAQGKRFASHGQAWRAFQAAL